MTRRKNPLLGCFVASATALLCGVSLSAQLAFEVASIKDSRAAGEAMTFRLLPDGIRAENVPVMTLLTIGHDVRRFQLGGLPSWTREARFDLQARVGKAATRQDTFAMIRTMLADRFQLQFHRESREIDGYALIRLRPDRLGPGLKPSAFDCEKRFEDACRAGQIVHNEPAASTRMVGAPIWNLQQVLIGELDAPIDDQTGLSGTFDIDVRWSSALAATADPRRSSPRCRSNLD